jgi:hypothetical protein
MSGIGPAFTAWLNAEADEAWYKASIFAAYTAMADRYNLKTVMNLSDQVEVPDGIYHETEKGRQIIIYPNNWGNDDQLSITNPVQTIIRVTKSGKTVTLKRDDVRSVSVERIFFTEKASQIIGASKSHVRPPQQS